MHQELRSRLAVIRDPAVRFLRIRLLGHCLEFLGPHHAISPSFLAADRPGVWRCGERGTGCYKRQMELVRLLPGFVLAVVLITATPGPAFALVVQRTAVRGLPHGLATLTGTGLGLYTWVLLVASGLAVVAASEIGFIVLKVVGTVVLAWFALRAFSAWRQLRSEPATQLAGAAPVTSPTTSAPFHAPQAIRAIGEGFTVQMANPKAAIFLLALYPQFVPPTMPLFQTAAILGVVQVAIESSLYIALALGVHRAGEWFRRSVVKRRLEAATGTVLLVLGVRLAFSHR